MTITARCYQRLFLLLGLSSSLLVKAASGNDDVGSVAAAADSGQEQQHQVCGELVGCALYDITNALLSPQRVAELYTDDEDVTYELNETAEYSISCQVISGYVDLLYVVYGDGTKHKESTAPYWVGGKTPKGRPRPVSYLATTGEKEFSVSGWLYDVECFSHTQKLMAMIRPSSPGDNDNDHHHHHEVEEEEQIIQDEL